MTSWRNATLEDLATWARENSDVLAVVWERFAVDAEWPDALVLTRQRFSVRPRRDFTAAAREMPPALGRLDIAGGPQRIVLTPRGLSFVPSAAELLDDFARLVRIGIDRYADQEGEAVIGAAELQGLLDIDELRARQLEQIVLLDSWLFRANGGSPGAGDLRIAIDDHVVLLVADIKTAPEYLEAQATAWWPDPADSSITREELAAGQLETITIVPPALPFHVRVSTDEARRRLDRTDEAFAFHISEAAVRERFVDPWQSRETVLCDGLGFPPGHTRIEIVEGSTYSSQPYRGHRDWELAKNEGRNVTDRFLRRRAAADAQPGGQATAENPARVMVVHGRDLATRGALFAFLRALKLDPIEWGEAVHATGTGTPYNGEAVDAAFAIAQAAIVLCTPDEQVILREDLRDPDEPSERQLAWQPRPNVYFEGGIAFTSHPTRTIVVELGRIRPASDLLGRNVVRIDAGPEWRHSLAERLKRAGCPVDTTGTDWLTAGVFPSPPATPEPKPPVLDRAG